VSPEQCQGIFSVSAKVLVRQIGCLMSVELNEAFFAKIAGWQAMKEARGLLATEKVLSSNWSPPVLKGVVQEGTTSYRAGLVIKDPINIENLCGCRPSREWGTICAHSVGVGLHHLNQKASEARAQTAARSESTGKSRPSAGARSAPQRLQRNASGEPAELHIILPPNFEQAAVRGKVMLCLEAKWRGGRAPLNALPRSETFAFSNQDAALLDQLEILAEGETPAMLLLETTKFAALLPLLVEHPRVTFGKSVSVTVAKEPWAPGLKAVLGPSGEIELTLKEKVPAPLIIEGEWVFRNQRFQPLGLSKASLRVFGGPLRFSRAEVPPFLIQDWPRLQATATVEANFRVDDFTLEPQPPRFLLELKGGLAQLHALLQCAYGPRIMTPGTTSPQESLWLPDPNSATRYSTRDLNAEREALDLLLRNGFTGPDAQGRYQLLGQNAVLNFFARQLPRLEKQWEVTLEERLERSTAQSFERIEPRFQITPSGVQWFELEVSFASKSGERFSAAEIQRLVLSGQSHCRLKNGKLALIDTGAVEELQEVLLDCSPQQHAERFRVNNVQAGFLEATLRQQAGWQVQAPPDWRHRAQQQSGEAKLDCPPLGQLETVLRPYQKAGVAWLEFLRQNNFGGILADEMGLGKTLQTLALLQSHPVETRQGALKPTPALIVCPTSLVFNWLAEAKKFTPTLKVLALEGPNREALFQKIPDHDVVVTSYALIRRDADRYREFEFDTVVLDEAQHIKNRQTQNAQAVKAVRARHRLVLTGTPMENSVLDLWSIFDFLMPGYLGSAQDFRERYEIPITRDKAPPVQARLARRLRPFILRRLKRDVARDLPAKLEQVSFCELTEEQRAVYQQVIEASRREVMESVGAEGLARSRMVILTALLRLRQVCCDLRLLKLEHVDPATASAKLDLFGELLEEVIDGGHRVLVFSQFVTMLGLLREKLTENAIDFCYLDGSTTNRSQVVERFQTGAIPVFLISLKAGGVGLNLTGADTVIHFDPWWNPAVEEQASDRAHRIGQTRVVTSYKLITRNTVEEKILGLQARKREIIQATLAGEEQLAEALSWEEIQELFAS
jgi:superfamily II DNA or RNA helicase